MTYILTLAALILTAVCCYRIWSTETANTTPERRSTVRYESTVGIITALILLSAAIALD